MLTVQLTGARRGIQKMQFLTMSHNKPQQISDMTLRATVRGYVQGVFFRAFVHDAAERLGLGGYVRNQPDGSVYVEARGDRAALEELLGLLWRGPERARVSIVEHEWLQGETGVSKTHFEVYR
jgi:acylphosphatase